MQFLAGAIGMVLLGLAIFHVYWAVAGVRGGAAVPSRPDGTPVLRPGPVAALAVAAALTIGAWLVLPPGAGLPPVLPDRWTRLGAWGVAAAFAARTCGEFRYVGLFRRVRGTPFARWDAWLFTPLCAALAAGTAVVAAS
jgi:hypothetical protein